MSMNFYYQFKIHDIGTMYQKDNTICTHYKYSNSTRIFALIECSSQYSMWITLRWLHSKDDLSVPIIDYQNDIYSRCEYLLDDLYTQHYYDNQYGYVLHNVIVIINIYVLYMYCYNDN